VSVRGFRFRAQAALDLRRREDDDAQRGLARAHAELLAAEAVVRSLEERAAEARTQWAGLMQQPGGAAQHWWYRSWITRLDRELAASKSAAAARQKDHARAVAARVRTHQRVEALERFKEKSAKAWERRMAADEQKHLDTLATLRFFAAMRRKQEETGANE
jgi:flagellar export protein FliJ